MITENGPPSLDQPLDPEQELQQPAKRAKTEPSSEQVCPCTTSACLHFKCCATAQDSLRCRALASHQQVLTVRHTMLCKHRATLLPCSLQPLKPSQVQPSAL